MRAMTSRHALLVLCLASLPLVACKKSPTVGAECETAGEATCKDKTTMLNCAGGKWEGIACKGPEGCQTTGAIVKCDESLAAENDSCGSEGGDHYSCTPDKKGELKCLEGKWKLVGKCGGPKGCEAKFPFVKCDNSISAVGDLCAKDGDAACSTDGKAILECKSGKFSEAQKCEKGKCKAEGLFVKCE